MTGSIMPAARRRFLVMLWLSLALHALVIGLTQLPPPVKVPLATELSVEIDRPESAAPPMPAQRPEVRAQRPLAPARQETTRPLLSVAPAPQPVAQAETPSHQALPAPPVPVATPVREASGPAIAVPLLLDTRYYTARELDVQPSALTRPEPLYPARAEELGVAGRVLIRLNLEADGSISRTEVMSVTPGGVYGEMFRKATLDSLKGVRFKPAQRNGQPVRAVVEIPVVFEPDS